MGGKAFALVKFSKKKESNLLATLLGALERFPDLVTGERMELMGDESVA
jgi:hypothetical protein